MVGIDGWRRPDLRLMFGNRCGKQALRLFYVVRHRIPIL